MSWYNWLIVIIPFSFVLWMAFYSRRYIRDVVDYLAAGRVCGRYVICVADLASGLGLITMVAAIEVSYKAGFAYEFWRNLSIPLGMCLSLTGFFYYRFRETKAMTFGELMERRYSRGFRIFAAALRTTSEMLTNTIGPAIAARFFIYLFGWPSTLDLFGWKVPTFSLLVAGTLLLALLVIWAGGMISMVVTDALQAIMSYPIFLIITIFVLWKFDWFGEVVPTLSNRVPGESFLNPMDIRELRDFNLFSVTVLLFGMVLNRGVWCGGGTDTAAKTAHEGKMAGILGAWRNGLSALMVTLLAITAITLMNHVHFCEEAKTVRIALADQIMEDKNYDSAVRRQVTERYEAIPLPQSIPPQSVRNNEDLRYLEQTRQVLLQEQGQAQGNASYLEFRTLYHQMLLPTVLHKILPGPLLAFICLLALLLMLSTDDSRIFSSARTLAQDVVLPLIHRPMSTKRQLWVIRWLTLFVSLVFFFGSLFLSQLDYINLYITIASSIWIGGAGAVTLGALYTRFGTTAGAYASILSGAVLSVGSIAVQRNWPDHVYPWLEKWNMVESCDRFLRWISSPFVPYIRWEMSPVKFPINSVELFFMTMLFSIAVYCIVSFLTCKKPYDLDKLLYRGKYNTEGKTELHSAWTWKNFLSKIIGITPEYTRGDRTIAWGIFVYSFLYLFCCAFLGVLIWNFFSPRSKDWWGGYFFVTGLLIPGIIGVISTVWFMWGGIRDLCRLFKDLAIRKSDPSDNGMIHTEEGK